MNRPSGRIPGDAIPASPSQTANDQAEAAWLKARGYRVIDAIHPLRGLPYNTIGFLQQRPSPLRPGLPPSAADRQAERGGSGYFIFNWEVKEAGGLVLNIHYWPTHFMSKALREHMVEAVTTAVMDKIRCASHRILDQDLFGFHGRVEGQHFYLQSCYVPESVKARYAAPAGRHDLCCMIADVIRTEILVSGGALQEQSQPDPSPLEEFDAGAQEFAAILLRETKEPEPLKAAEPLSARDVLLALMGRPQGSLTNTIADVARVMRSLGDDPGLQWVDGGWAWPPSTIDPDIPPAPGAPVRNQV